MTALDAFTELVRTPAPQFPLLECAAELPLYSDRRCDPRRVVATVRGWGAQLRARVAADMSAPNRLRLLHHYYFDELGFHPNTGNYYSPDNSYLHRVVERRTGIPISLALLYIEIGRAIGLKLSGIGFPGHFLVKAQCGEGLLFIDVFARGVSLSAADLRHRLDQVLRGTKAPLEAYLRVASEREILARMLHNLKAIHAHGEQWQALLEVQNRLVALLPDSAEERRDRGLAYAQLECPRAAANDLAAYLTMEPGASDREDIRERLAQLRRAASALN
jgi:regulator of sirC expression with transglutaminase-like and TPR domain